MAGRTLAHAEAKAFYDRFGALQDKQFYENPALDDLIHHAALGRARAILEFGCGTGRLAASLLAGQLPPDAQYLGLDISETMVALARERLAPWRSRAEVRQTDGGIKLEIASNSQDAFISTYVLDLLSEHEIRLLLTEAHRILKPGGRLCLAGLTFGSGLWGRLLTRLWQKLHAFHPQWVGGCRPVRLTDYLPEQAWHIEHHRMISRFGIVSEVLIAAKR